MKKILGFLLILLLIGGAVGYYGYSAIFSPNVLIDQEEKIIHIPSGSNYENVIEILEKEDIIRNQKTFSQVAKAMKYGKTKVPTGRYKVKPNWSNKELISLLRSGKQSPVKVTFNNLRTTADLAGRISSYLEVDSLDLLSYFTNENTLKDYNTDQENFISLFIPNTYEMYWNEDPSSVLKRLTSESEKFWQQKDRAKKAETIGLSKSEVITMASIVEKESLRTDEKPIIAGIYINRIKQGIPLQADPTVVFGLKAFHLKRVLFKHLEINTPYNTYMHPGLPPGPICLPAISSIDAVLNYKKHNLLYFCAKPESNGGHLFASSLAEHNANARVYHRWLDKQGIK